MRSAWSAGIKENGNPEKKHFGETDFFEMLLVIKQNFLEGFNNKDNNI